MALKEKELFPPLKKYFKELGYKVFAEVPSSYRGVDFVAVKGDDHIAVEMKTCFNRKVIQQASDNRTSFGKSYIAFPVKKPKYFKMGVSERDIKKYNLCKWWGVGILEVLPFGIIFEALEAKYEKPWRIFDFSQYEERVDDEAGIPCQKGVSMGYMELKAIKAYVEKHPTAKWKEIFENVQNHYSNPSSLSGSMSQWRGFSLRDFKESLKDKE